MLKRLVLPVMLFFAGSTIYAITPPEIPPDPPGYRESVERHRSGPTIEDVLRANHEPLSSALEEGDY